MEAALQKGDRSLSYSGLQIEVPEIHQSLQTGALALGIRPEHVTIADSAPLRGRVFAVEYLGTNQIVTILRAPARRRC